VLWRVGALEGGYEGGGQEGAAREGGARGGLGGAREKWLEGGTLEGG
jgi:hypothetical protein